MFTIECEEGGGTGPPCLLCIDDERDHEDVRDPTESGSGLACLMVMVVVVVVEVMVMVMCAIQQRAAPACMSDGDGDGGSDGDGGDGGDGGGGDGGDGDGVVMVMMADLRYQSDRHGVLSLDIVFVMFLKMTSLSGITMTRG